MFEITLYLRRVSTEFKESKYCIWGEYVPISQISRHDKIMLYYECCLLRVHYKSLDDLEWQEELYVEEGCEGLGMRGDG